MVASARAVRHLERAGRCRRRPAPRRSLRRLPTSGPGALLDLRPRAAHGRTSGVARPRPRRPGAALGRCGVRRTGARPGDRAQGAPPARAPRPARPAAVARRPGCPGRPGGAGPARAGAVATRRRSWSRPRPDGSGHRPGGRAPAARRCSTCSRCRCCAAAPEPWTRQDSARPSEPPTSPGRCTARPSCCGGWRLGVRTCGLVICDDVVTTGATLREAQRALEAVGLEVTAVAAVAATRRRIADRTRSAPFLRPIRRTNVSSWSPSGSVVASSRRPGLTGRPVGKPMPVAGETVHVRRPAPQCGAGVDHGAA